MSAHI
jgi:hypothetical protein